MLVVEERVRENYDVTSILRDDTINLSSMVRVTNFLHQKLSIFENKEPNIHVICWVDSSYSGNYIKDQKTQTSCLICTDSLLHYSPSKFFTIITKCYQTITLAGLKFSALETCHF